MRNDDSSTCPINDDGQQHRCINCLIECDENEDALDHYNSADSRYFLIFQETENRSQIYLFSFLRN